MGTKIEGGREATIGLEVIGATSDRRVVAGTIRAVRPERVEDGKVVEAAKAEIVIATVTSRGRVLNLGHRVEVVELAGIVALEDLPRMFARDFAGDPLAQEATPEGAAAPLDAPADPGAQETAPAPTDGQKGE